VFVATCLEHGPSLLTEPTGQGLAAEFLGLRDTTLHEVIAKLPATGDPRAQVLLLGMVVAALEGRTPKDAWRNAASHYNPVPGAAEYLRFLAVHGYQLSEIEKVAMGQRTADDVHGDLAAPT
jgi:ParB family chromosome partitioning protein